MTIAVGDKIPDAVLLSMGEAGIAKHPTAEFFAGKTVALFSVPGAFTPTCTANHLPPYVERAEELKAKGADVIACTAVNDPFVMAAWGKAAGADGKVLMLSDPAGEFAKGLGLSMDASAFGLGLRGQRFSMIVKDGVVATLNVEEAGAGVVVSGAETLLEQL